MSKSYEATTWQRKLTTPSADDAPSPAERQPRSPADTWRCEGWGPFVVRLAMGSEVSLNLLTIRDDVSRSLLGLTAGVTEPPADALSLLVDTATRWGLPSRLYCDRHAAWGTPALRNFMTRLGYRQ
jgi:hypothetical protein